MKVFIDPNLLIYLNAMKSSASFYKIDGLGSARERRFSSEIDRRHKFRKLYKPFVIY